MKILYKLIFIILASNFLSLNGMLWKKNISKDETTYQARQEIKLNELKTKCVFKVVELIKVGKICWERLGILPEDLGRYIVLFNTANIYFDNYGIDSKSNLSKLILETKELFYELIIAQSEHLEIFVSALDDFFEYHTKNLDENFKTDHSFFFTEHNSNEEPFRTIHLFLKIMLDPDNSANSIRNHDKLYYENKISEGNSLIKYLAINMLNLNLINLMNLLLSLNLFSRENLLELFRDACHSAYSPIMLQLINKHIHLTKNEFENMLSGQCNILIKSITRDDNNLDILKYVFELMENLKLDVIEIVNQRQNLATGQTLLHIAAIGGYLDFIEFLLTIGANLSVNDFNGSTPLDCAKQTHTLLQKIANLQSNKENELENNYINNQLKLNKHNLAIEFLKNFKKIQLKSP